MRIFIVLLAALFLSGVSFAQKADSTVPKTKKFDPKKFDFKNRANDHFMMQFGYDNWNSKPDSIRITGFGRHFNAYVMYDMPFKTDPRWSVGIGAGVGSSNIYFDKMIVDIKASSTHKAVSFKNVADTNQFKKFKVAETWLEAPLELRFVANPFNTNNSFKFAVGAKIGTLVSATSKGKDFQTKNGSTLYGSKYIVKEKEKNFFNGTRLAGTARIGYGPFSVYGAFQIINLFRETMGPPVRPYSIGLCISGL